MNISNQEREKYSYVWKFPDYAKYSPGEENVDRFLNIVNPAPSSTILDAGCGAGRGGLGLEAAGMDVWYLDITDAGLDGVNRAKFIQQPLWHEIRKPKMQLWDYGFCCDVMEHIPPEYTMLVARNLLSVCRVMWFQIAFFNDGFGKMVGHQLHLTVEPYQWWRDRLASLGRIIESRDLCGTGLFVMEFR